MKKLFTILIVCALVIGINELIAGALQDPDASGALVQLPAWLMSLPALICVSILGMFIHFLKKNVAGETTTDIRNYFRDHFKSTFIALSVTVISTLAFYGSLATGQPADLVTIFLLGFGFDSTLNKWQAKVQNVPPAGP